jgi:hypothetical protein
MMPIISLSKLRLRKKRERERERMNIINWFERNIYIYRQVAPISSGANHHRSIVCTIT